MGVPGLWPLLSDAATQYNLETLDLAALGSPPPANGDDGAHRKMPVVGVDISAWLFHARLSVEGSNPILRLIFFRLARLMTLPIQAVFVFDGPYRPHIKRGKAVGGRRHPLTGPLTEMINACGAVAWEAPGEAEAQLARASKEGMIDAVLSDDVDALVFGATAVMRNWSSANANAAGGTDDSGENAVTIYKASDIQELPELALDREGFILVAVLAGGDYDVKGLGGCGVKMAIALAQGGYGAALVRGFKDHCRVVGYDAVTKLPTVSESSGWTAFLQKWLSDIRSELITNKQGFLPKKQAKLADSEALKTFLTTTESLEVLASYIEPVTSWSFFENSALSSSNVDLPPLPRHFRFRDPNLSAMASFSQKTFAWGPRYTLGRLRNVAWKGLLLRSLREKSVSISKEADVLGCDSSGSDSDGEPSRHRRGPLLLKIHSERTHATTGKLLEYRLEWDPTCYAKAAQEGIDLMLNVGPGFDEPFPGADPSDSGLAQQNAAMAPSPAADDDDEDDGLISPYGLILATDGDGDSQAQPPTRKSRPPPDPYSSLRTWVLADRLKALYHGRKLIERYENTKGARTKAKRTREGPSSKRASAKPRTATKSGASTARQLGIDSMFPAQKKTASRVVCAPKASCHSDRSSSPVQGSAKPKEPTASSRGLPPRAPALTQRTFARTQSGPAMLQSPARPSKPGQARALTRRSSVISLEDEPVETGMLKNIAAPGAASADRVEINLLTPVTQTRSTVSAAYSSDDADCSLPDASRLLFTTTNPLRDCSSATSSPPSPIAGADSRWELSANGQGRKRGRVALPTARRDLREGTGSPEPRHCRAISAAGGTTSRNTVPGQPASAQSQTLDQHQTRPTPGGAIRKADGGASSIALSTGPDAPTSKGTSRATTFTSSVRPRGAPASSSRARGARKSDAIVLSDSEDGF